MLRPRQLAVLGLALCGALVTCAQPTDVASERSIPATEDNQEYFATTQSLFAVGNPRESSCGDQSDRIEECIKSCNSPGLEERSGCCCDARPSREFYVGVRGGCRYRQQLQNFTTRLVYSSTPLDEGPRYFDAISCAATSETESEEICTCSKSWQASVEDLAVLSPLPTPSPSKTPGLSPSPAETSEPAAPSPGGPPAITLVPLATIVPQGSPVVVISPPVAVVSPRPPARTPSPSRTPSPAGGGETTTEEPAGTDDEEGSPGASVEASDGSSGDGDDDSDEDDDGDSDDDEDDDDTDSEEDDGSVCVEEKHLVATGVPRDHMVHATGVRASVLCPGGALPCGTPNHKIRREGRSLSYADLCREIATCQQRIAVVNSVYTHLWDETEHDGIHLTMYDVSYPESAQLALHSVMRFGREVVRRFRGTAM